MAKYFGEVLGKYLDKLVVLRGDYRGSSWWTGYNFMPLDKAPETTKVFNTLEEVEEFVKENYSKEEVDSVNAKISKANDFEEFWMPRHMFFSQPLGSHMAFGKEYFRDRYGDWFEDFEHENGQYLNKCVTCGNTFHGHKRRVTCKLCYYGREDPNNV